MTQPLDAVKIALTVNGEEVQAVVEPRLSLADFLRRELSLTGTHLGCEHGVCGACTVLMDGASVRSCLVLAVQADGAEVATVEGLAAQDAPLSPLQQAFSDAHGLQCGFCTPGFLMSAAELLAECEGVPDEGTVRAHLGGNLCRCTGYQNIVRAVRMAAAQRGGNVS